MKKVLALFGVVAACGLCCAAPLIFAALGLGASGATAAFWGWQAGIAVFAAVAVVATLLWKYKASCKKPATADASCGCGPSCGPAR